MKQLALDTSSGTSVAVLSQGVVLAEVNFAENMTHAERIGSTIEQALHTAGVKAAEIEQVVVGLGPGPFTGLRVGIAAAKFFAIGVDAELVGVCSLDAIAHKFYETGTGDLLVTTDARRKELFWAKYSGVDSGIPVRTQGPTVSKPEDISSVGYQITELAVSAGSLGQIAYAQGAKANREIVAIYLREPDATPGKGKKVSG